LSGDWLFVPSITEYESAVKERPEGRPAPLDAREVLYGKPLFEFIANECHEAASKSDEHLVSAIHARWLMTPREDLRNMTPREVLLEKKDFIDFELHSRALQWSFTGECPAPLPASSTAYRFSGFGIHEIVIYYELFRYLLNECIESPAPPDSQWRHLEQLKSIWINTPSQDYYGRTPSAIVQLERRRINMSMSTRDFFSDQDDADELAALHMGTPMIWHLDGCNMDEDFEFSFHKTREEFDEEEGRRIEFNRQFEIDRKAGKYDKPFDEWSIDSGTDSPF
jgi:hypothetical protein